MCFAYIACEPMKLLALWDVVIAYVFFVHVTHDFVAANHATL
jgi:hypothetical protein